MKKIIFAIMSVVILIAVGSGVFLYLEYQKVSTEPNKFEDTFTTSTVLFEVPKNATGDQVLQKLEDEKLLSSATWFKVYTRLNNVGLNFKAGAYQLPVNMKFIDLVAEFQKMINKDIVLTILPGLRVDEIVNSIDETMRTESDTKIAPISYDRATLENYVYGRKVFDHPATKLIPTGKLWEGILIGDTYFIKQGATTEEILTKILDHFWQNFKEARSQESSRMTQYSDYEVLTLASIIERENDGTEEHAALISGVFVNRVESNTTLGSDVTILYSKKDWRATIYQEDLDNQQDPYNTRVHLGLPPTPICNPTIKSIQAAFNPKDTDYLFFIADRNGTIRFARTLYEHNQNIAKYGLSGE